MTSSRIPVPHDPAALSTWVSDFEAVHGMPPIAGGETPAGGAPAVTQPPPAPQPQPAQPAASAQAAPAAPQPPQAQMPPFPGAPMPDPAQGAPAQPQGEQPPPDWAQQLLQRMDDITGPPQIDPLAAELFGPGPGQPQAPQQGQPQIDPQAPPAGLPPQLPGQPQVMPGQPQPALGDPSLGQSAVPPQPGLPGQPPAVGDPTQQLVNDLIDGRARDVAEQLIRDRVAPYFQQEAQRRRQSEALALTEEYPELRDPNAQNALMARSRQWAQQITGSQDLAGEPGWVEVCFLAGKWIEAQERAQQPQAQPQGQPPQPGIPALATGPGTPEVPIEQPGGSNPGAAQTPQAQIAQRIVGAGSGGQLSPLWK